MSPAALPSLLLSLPPDTHGRPLGVTDGTLSHHYPAGGGGEVRVAFSVSTEGPESARRGAGGGDGGVWAALGVGQGRARSGKTR